MLLVGKGAPSTAVAVCGGAGRRSGGAAPRGDLCEMCVGRFMLSSVFRFLFICSFV